MEKLVAGDVLVVPFPLTNLARAKRRPAFVLAALAGGDLYFLSDYEPCLAAGDTVADK